MLEVAHGWETVLSKPLHLASDKTRDERRWACYIYWFRVT